MSRNETPRTQDHCPVIRLSNWMDGLRRFLKEVGFEVNLGVRIGKRPAGEGGDVVYAW